MSDATPPHRREIELDFIRGIAILMVIDFHSPHTLLLAPFAWLGFANFGWAGVDIFFVLSGFLVGGLLVKEWKLRRRIDARRFLIRRGFKIWPQYYVYLAVMLLTRHRTFHQLWGNLLNIQNYVGGVAHTWTLAVEEHAYLILLFVLAFAARRALPVRRVFQFLLLMAAAVVVNRFILTALGVNTFTRTDTRVDGILYGVMLAILYHHAPRRFAQLQRSCAVLVAVVAATLVCFRFFPQTGTAAASEWLLADCSGVALLLLLYRHNPALRRPAVYRFVAQIGLYSYGIYLWHVSIMEPVAALSRHMPRVPGFLWTLLAPPILGVLLGIVFTKLVEFPALTLRDRLFPRRVDAAIGIPAQVEAESGIEGEPESVSYATEA